MTALLNPVPAQRARLLLAQGDLAAAADWSRRRGLAPDDPPSYPREPNQLVLARVLLAQGRPDRALGLLERLRALAVTQQRTGSRIEIQALRALALAAAGADQEAVATLAEALTLACRQGHLRVLADEGAPMGTLLGKLVAAQRTQQPTTGQVPLDYLGALARSVQTSRDAPGLGERLTARELEVLGLLAAGRSNQRIAEELVVTIDTVKKHVSHVLDKLGAGNRTEAVARARQLGLLR